MSMTPLKSQAFVEMCDDENEDVLTLIIRITAVAMHCLNYNHVISLLINLCAAAWCERPR